MTIEAELWQFISDRLTRDQSVILQVVAESSGSSPGRQGYKMAVAEDGELVGSIGCGVMEVSLVDQSRAILSGPGSGSPAVELSEQVHRKDVRNSSGMICSGRQTVIFTRLGPSDVDSVELAVASFRERRPVLLQISP
jgi:xanthine dehydrogenase accessory factor